VRPDVIAGFSDGVVWWRSPIGDHFPLLHTTDRGWHFELYESDAVHVGSVGRGPVFQDDDYVHWNLAQASTAAISASDGSARWRHDGTSFACSGKVAVVREVSGGRWETWPVRCRYRGTSRYDKGAGTSTYADLDVVVEGFEVASGRTTWSVPLGAAVAFMHEAAAATVVSDSEVLVQAETGPVAVSLADGATRRPGAGEAFWCATRVVEFEYRETLRLASGSVNTWRGGTLFDPCTANGEPTSAVPATVASYHGVTVGERTVVSTGRGLVAYDRRG
jgi:hypothetical protein